MTPLKIDKPLSNLRLAFCREYAIDHNGKQAAIRAGYSPKGAEVRGSELLTKCKVKEEIARIEAEKVDKTGYTLLQYQKQLEAARDRAERWQQPSAEVSAIVAKGRSMGYDKSRVINEDDTDSPTPEEAEDISAARRENIALTSIKTG